MFEVFLVNHGGVKNRIQKITPPPSPLIWHFIASRTNPPKKVGPKSFPSLASSTWFLWVIFYVFLQQQKKIHVLEAIEGKDLGPTIFWGVVLEAMKGQILFVDNFRGYGGPN